MKAQDRVAKAVRERGYYEKPNGDPWTKEQLAARQVAKLAEELGELSDVIPQYGIVRGYWQRDLGVASIRARRSFDTDCEWEDAKVLDKDAAASELADLQVVLFTLADALGVDVVDLAVAKAENDIERGGKGR